MQSIVHKTVKTLLGMRYSDCSCSPITRLQSLDSPRKALVLSHRMRLYVPVHTVCFYDVFYCNVINTYLWMASLIDTRSYLIFIHLSSPLLFIDHFALSFLIFSIFTFTLPLPPYLKDAICISSAIHGSLWYWSLLAFVVCWRRSSFVDSLYSLKMSILQSIIAQLLNRACLIGLSVWAIEREWHIIHWFLILQPCYIQRI